MSPAAAAELAAAAEDPVEDAVEEPDIMLELVIIDDSIIVDDIIVSDIISLDIIDSDIIVSDIIMVSVSDIIVSVMSTVDIVTVGEACVVVDWAAARALRVQTITVMKRMLDF